MCWSGVLDCTSIIMITRKKFQKVIEEYEVLKFDWV